MGSLPHAGCRLSEQLHQASAAACSYVQLQQLVQESLASGDRETDLAVGRDALLACQLKGAQGLRLLHRALSSCSQRRQLLLPVAAFRLQLAATQQSKGGHSMPSLARAAACMRLTRLLHEARDAAARAPCHYVLPGRCAAWHEQISSNERLRACSRGQSACMQRLDVNGGAGTHPDLVCMLLRSLSNLQRPLLPGGQHLDLHSHSTIACTGFARDNPRPLSPSWQRRMCWGPGGSHWSDAGCFESSEASTGLHPAQLWPWSVVGQAAPPGRASTAGCAPRRRPRRRPCACGPACGRPSPRLCRRRCPGATTPACRWSTL